MNNAARRVGITPGMALATAQSLHPGLTTAPATPAQDAAALEKLAEWCLWVSPLVAVDPPDGVWIETTGCDHLFAGEAALLETLRDRLAPKGYTIRAAIADTAGAAHAEARYGRDALAVIPSRAQNMALDPLPVTSLRLEPDIVASLDRMGIHRIADLRAAPRAPLTRRFGTTPLRQLDRALGHAPEPLTPLIPHDAVMAHRALVEPIGTAESIAAVIVVLIQDVCATLEQRGQGARQLDLLCTRVDGVTIAVRVGTSEPVRNPAQLRRLLGDRIETIEPGFGIEAMSLRVDRTDAIRTGTADHDLLDTAQTSTSLDGLIDRLRNRLGTQAVFSLAAVASHIPERTQTRLRLHARMTDTLPRLHGPRPTRLLDPPEVIAILALLPEGAPRQFFWRGERHRVACADGPERLHGEWWLMPDEAGLIRDYWIVETQTGERFWLFRRGDGTHGWSGDGAWFLHGLF